MFTKKELNLPSSAPLPTPPSPAVPPPHSSPTKTISSHRFPVRIFLLDQRLQRPHLSPAYLKARAAPGLSLPCLQHCESVEHHGLGKVLPPQVPYLQPGAEHLPNPARQ